MKKIRVTHKKTISFMGAFVKKSNKALGVNKIKKRGKGK
jgi:hypothetical protein